MGFLKQDRAATLARFGLEDSQKIHIIGDAASGPSLVVRALADGKKLVNRLN